MSNKSRHFILTPVGSAGDVHPFLWIGRILVARGHRVTVLVSETFEAAVREAGLEPSIVATAEEYNEGIRDPDIWHPVKGIKRVIELSARIIPRAVKRIERVIESPQKAILVGSLLSVGARIVREKHRIPLVTVHLQPSVILSAHDTPFFGRPFALINSLPFWGRKLVLSLPSPVDFAFKKHIESACKLEGISPPRSFSREWWNSPDGVVCLFPEWLAAPQPDWPARLIQTGFPLYDRAGEMGLPRDVEIFLASGEKPLLFTAGTAMIHGESFFRTAVECCERLGKRGVLVTGHAAQLPSTLPPSIIHLPYVAFSQIFPRAAVVVHHGGIGTLSQALAAGVPQVIMPMAHDQPDNARRLVKMGGAECVYPDKFNIETVSRAIARLLADPKVATACASMAELARQRPDEVKLAEFFEASKFESASNQTPANAGIPA